MISSHVVPRYPQHFPPHYMTTFATPIFGGQPKLTNALYNFPACKKQPPPNMQAADTRETIIVITLTSLPLAEPDLPKMKPQA